MRKKEVMTKNFENRVMIERTIDTNNYRYKLEEKGDHAEIKRIPLSALGTTATVEGWEVVKEVR